MFPSGEKRSAVTTKKEQSMSLLSQAGQVAQSRNRTMSLAHHSRGFGLGFLLLISLPSQELTVADPGGRVKRGVYGWGRVESRGLAYFIAKTAHSCSNGFLDDFEGVKPVQQASTTRNVGQFW
jgi:hypothetical protein